jgi:hypothetical protein
VPEKHLIEAAEHERSSLKHERRRAVGSGDRKPVLANTDVAPWPGARKHSLRRTGVVLSEVQAWSRAGLGLDRKRDQRHDDLGLLSNGGNDQRQWP